MERRHNTTKAFKVRAYRALYEVPHTYRTRTPRWFPEPRCRTLDRQLTPFGPTTRHYDGDTGGDGRRRRRTETDSLWGRVVVVNTALRPQKPDGLLGTERAPLTSSDTQSRELSAGDERSGSSFIADDTRD